MDLSPREIVGFRLQHLFEGIFDIGGPTPLPPRFATLKRHIAVADDGAVKRGLDKSRSLPGKRQQRYQDAPQPREAERGAIRFGDGDGDGDGAGGDRGKIDLLFGQRKRRIQSIGIGCVQQIPPLSVVRVGLQPFLSA